MTVLARHDNGAIAAVLPDGARRHFQHGPIDLVLRADGAPSHCETACAAAWERFPYILPELVGEITMLREALFADSPRPSGPVAVAMDAVCRAHLPAFVTPMAAVAGAVADEIAAVMAAAAPLDRAFVNNGGDIAIRLGEGHALSAGVVMDQDAPSLDAFAEIDAASPVRGIATSGWKGRSCSLGIADSVTVLATSAAAADVAATLIANAVTVDDPAVERAPAVELDPDSDLGERLVTTAVGRLAVGKIAAAMDAGEAAAAAMLDAGLIHGALLSLQGQTRTVSGAVEQRRLAAE